MTEIDSPRWILFFAYDQTSQLESLIFIYIRLQLFTNGLKKVTTFFTMTTQLYGAYKKLLRLQTLEAIFIHHQILVTHSQNISESLFWGHSVFFAPLLFTLLYVSQKKNSFATNLTNLYDGFGSEAHIDPAAPKSTFDGLFSRADAQGVGQREQRSSLSPKYNAKRLLANFHPSILDVCENRI